LPNNLHIYKRQLMNSINNSYHLQEKREEFFTDLYKKAFPAVAKYVSRLGGSFDEAKDVFQDALVIYYEKTVIGSLTAKNDTAYLVGTAKHLWIRKYRENEHNCTLDNVEITLDADEQRLSANRLMHFLEASGKKCMELLRSFYYDQVPLTEIASTYGYSGVRSATVQKYKCLEKVRETIKEKALAYEDFME
jgi:DNA-directed RNA polymerase specialized sigma24 family protein